MPLIYEYVNYRLFLKDFLAEAKGNRQHQFSHKAVLDRLGISSTGFLSNVIAGRKNLTPIQVSRLGKALQLTAADETYFEAMVYFTQAKTIDERNEFFNRMVMAQKVTMKVLDARKLTLFSKWYYVIIREALNFFRYRDGDDPRPLALMIEPPIKTSEALEAVRYLESMGFIEKDADGFYHQLDGAITTGDEVKSLHLANFQLDTMDLAKRALLKTPPEERDISVLTMTLSKDAYRLIKSELQVMRKKLAKIALEDTRPERVYQLNMQLFPATGKGEKKNAHR